MTTHEHLAQQLSQARHEGQLARDENGRLSIALHNSEKYNMSLVETLAQCQNELASEQKEKEHRGRVIDEQTAIIARLEAVAIEHVGIISARDAELATTAVLVKSLQVEIDDLYDRIEAVGG